MPRKAPSQKLVERRTALDKTRQGAQGRVRVRKAAPIKGGLPTEKERLVFLNMLAGGFSVAESSRQAGKPVSIFKRLRDVDQSFAQQWVEAYETGTFRLEHVAQQRAIGGSDQLLMFLLKARRPDVYRERSSVDISSSTLSTDDLARARELGQKALEDDGLGSAIERVAAEFARRATEGAPAPVYAEAGGGEQAG